jgi:hypothetical protein
MSWKQMRALRLFSAPITSARTIPRPSTRLKIGFLATLCALACGHTGLTDETVPIIRIEEDWVVEIGVPDPEGDAPQIINVFTPNSDLERAYSVFELNHSTQPEYGSGGMQLQAWDLGELVDYGNRLAPQALSVENEVVSYTLAMSLSDGQLIFRVLNGSSETWGNFGGESFLKASLNSSLANLNSYSPDVSTQHSRIGYASHRVKRFRLAEVRYYSAAGLVSTDTTSRIVFEHPAEQF